MKPDDETLRTSWTLVARLKHADGESWREFYEVYSRFIVGVAVKAGLREDEAEDVVQDTMAGVAADIHAFEASPDRGSFRPWLLTRVRWRIQDRFRKRLPAGPGRQSTLDATGTTSTLERLPDAREADLAGLCDAEWRARLREHALEQLQREVRAAHYQVFHLLVIEQKPVAEVARIVGVNRARLYLIKYRVSKTLAKIVARLEKKLG
jgi:RNA polymerase sigma-70 factor (ECF subfamily)